MDEAGENEDAEEATNADAGFRHDIEDAFRACPLPQRSFESAPQPHDPSLTDFDRLFDEQAAGGGDPTPGFYDEDAAAALQAELELP